MHQIEAITSESILASKVVQFMRDHCYECYFEVEGPGGRADIIGKSGRILHVVETKMSFNFKVIEQALNWRRYAHFVSVAVRKPKTRNSILYSWAMRDFVQLHGIGVITVKQGLGDCSIGFEIQPKLHRRVMDDRIHLFPEQMEWKQPGEVGGGYFTAFASTKKRLLEYIHRNPGCTMREIMENVPHHYSTDRSAKSSLHQYMVKGVIEGVRVEGSPAKYFIDEAEAMKGVGDNRPKGLDEYLERLTGDVE